MIRTRSSSWAATPACVVFLALSAVACGSSGSDAADTSSDGTSATTEAASSAAGDAVSIDDFAFSPASLTVEAGSTITWTNDQSSPHTITADDNSFDSGSIAQGEQFAQTFDTPGTFTYHCSIHPDMTATITVEG